MKTENNLLTIITVCFNSYKTLEQTINSVLNQNILNYEYIIIDGKSTDNTIQIIKSFENKFKQKNINYQWLSESDSGIYEAFNKGIKLSNGNWVSFLGSDDYYLKDALDIYSHAISKLNLNVDLIYSNVDIVDIKGKKKDVINGNWSWSKFKRYMNIAHVGAFHNKEYFYKYGYFDTSYKIAGDYELLLRAKEDLKTVKIEQTTAIMANYGASNKQINLVLKETLKAKNKTASLGFLLCKLDYYIAFLKYKTKKVISEIIR